MGRFWLYWLAIGAAAIGGYFLVPPNTGSSGLYYCVLSTTSALMIVVGVRTHRPAKPRIWYLLAAGQGVWALGDIVDGVNKYVLGRESCAPGFRGCPFINAAAEYADPAHPVRAVVAEHRRWMVGTAAALLGRLGLTDPEAAAEELVILRDGAMVAGYVGGEERARAVAAALQHAGAAVVAAHRPA